MAVAVNTLVTRITAIVDDVSYTAGDFINAMNKGYRELAGKVLLKDLETLTTLQTELSQNYTALPSGYHRNLSRWVYSSTQSKRLKLYDSLSELMMSYGDIDEAGALIGVARNERNMFYQPIPASAETFYIIHHSYPTTMTANTNVPAGIPEHLMEPILVHYACASIFEQMEDGIEGEKVNTLFHLGLYDKHFKSLEEFVKPPTGEPDGIPE